MHWFARAAVTSDHTLGDLNNRTLFSQFGKLEEVQDQGVGRLVSSEASLLGLQTATFSLSLTVFSMSTCTPGVSVCILISFLYKDTSQIGLESTLVASF